MAQLVYCILLVGQIFFFYTKIMDYKIKELREKTWFKLLFCIVVVIGAVSYSRTERIGLIMLAILGIPLILDCESKKAYGLLFPVVGVCISSNTIWYFFIYDTSNSIINEWKKVICLLITFIFLDCIYAIKTFKRINIRDISFTKNELIILNILTLFIGISLGEISAIQKGGESIKNVSIYISITTILCIIIYVFSIYLIFLNIRIVGEKNKSLYQQITLESQKNQIDAVLESEKRLYAYRHDLNAHLNALHYLAEDNDTAGIKEYCEKLLEYSQGFRNVIISGNTVVDGILGRELEKSKDKGIELELQVALLEKNKISDYELCIIFSNIINNAIDACVEGDKIKLACYPYNDYLCIMSENPIRKKITNIDDEIQTTKEDKVHHGYGIKNIRAVVDKYDGMMKIDTSNGIFLVEILV